MLPHFCVTKDWSNYRASKKSIEVVQAAPSKGGKTELLSDTSIAIKTTY